MSGPGTVVLSPLEEQRFGIRTARASELTAASLEEALACCREQGIRLLIARCRATELASVQAMERAGFELMDTLVHYRRDLRKTAIPPDLGSAHIRPIRPGEESTVREIAVEAFQNYSGHYHADPRLDRAQCDAAYAEWAVRSCTSREVADEVLVAEREGTLLGFATLKLNDPSQGEGVLFAVAAAAQGQGIYRSFMVQGMQWCVARGAAQMLVSTQLTNLAVQKVWVRVGFEPDQAHYTFHKWFDPEQPAP